MRGYEYFVIICTLYTGIKIFLVPKRDSFGILKAYI